MEVKREKLRALAPLAEPGSPEHLRIMQEFRDAGALYTNGWTAECFDPSLIWQQAVVRLRGRIAGVPHH